MTWLAWISAAAAQSADSIGAIEELDLGEILDLEVDVASGTTELARQAPSLVTVLTSEDIQRAGCRDLADALRLLPVLELVADVYQMTGIAVRGNNGVDGKVLFRIDGHEWNENAYGSFALGNRLPAAAIDRIEVIRGPGSAVYGGYASLAVVEVTTRAGSDRVATGADARVSWLDSGAYGSQNLVVEGGGQVGRAGRWGASASIGRGRVTEDVYSSFGGVEAPLVDASSQNPGLLSLDFRTGQTRLSILGEHYVTTETTSYGEPYALSQVSYSQGAAILRSAVRLGRTFRLAPWLMVQHQRPWVERGVASGDLLWEDRLWRHIVGVDVEGQATDAVRLRIGAEGGNDEFHVNSGPRTVEFVRGAAWVEGQARARRFLFTFGTRVDANSAYGVALSPRVAVTRAWDGAHVKLLMSRGFRAPSLYQALADIEPETSTTLEAEAGLAPTPWAYVTASVYDVAVYDAIIYLVEQDPDSGASVEGYTNVGHTGSRGGEFEVRAHTGALSVGLGVAAQVASDAIDGDPGPFAVARRPAAHLGIPNVKGVLRSSVRLPRSGWAGVVATALGPTYGVGPSGVTADTTRPAALVLDLNAGFRPLPRLPLTVAVDLHDVADVGLPLVQPHDGGHAFLPTAGRELGLRVSGEW